MQYTGLPATAFQDAERPCVNFEIDTGRHEDGPYGISIRARSPGAPASLRSAVTSTMDSDSARAT